MKKRVLSSEDNYAAIVRDHGYFVDKTPYIAKLEQVHNPVFLRPRRFGMSLLCSILRYYYVRNYADQFGGALWPHLDRPASNGRTKPVYRSVFEFLHNCHRANYRYREKDSHRGMALRLPWATARVRPYKKLYLNLYIQDIEQTLTLWTSCKSPTSPSLKCKR